MNELPAELSVALPKLKRMAKVLGIKVYKIKQPEILQHLMKDKIYLRYKASITSYASSE